MELLTALNDTAEVLTNLHGVDVELLLNIKRVLL